MSKIIELIKKYNITTKYGFRHKELVIKDYKKLQENKEDLEFFRANRKVILQVADGLPVIEEAEFNKPFIDDFVKHLENVRDRDKRCKWFNVKELIRVFVEYASKENGTQLISYDRYLYKYGIDDVVIQEKLKNFNDMYGNKPLEWYKANYYANMFSEHSPKKAKSIWLKLYAFLLLEKIRIKHFNFSEKYHIDVIIDFFKEN